MNQTEKLWTVEQAATFLRVRPGFVYRHASEIPHLRVGRLLRFQREALEHWVNERLQQSAGAVHGIHCHQPRSQVVPIQ